MKLPEQSQKYVDAQIKIYHRHLKLGLEERRKWLSTQLPPQDRENISMQFTQWQQELDSLEAGGFDEHIQLVEQVIPSNRERKCVEIVCLKYKEPVQEVKCVERIIKHTDWPFKLTLVDTRDLSANFAKLWNIYTAKSDCDYVLIMDSDAYVEEGWLTKLMDSFSDDFQCLTDYRRYPLLRPDQTDPVGLVVPITQQGAASTIQGQLEFKQHDLAFLTDAQVSGYFFLFKKAMWLDIGPFDERFYLHGQDSEWVDRVIASKWNTVVRPDVFVEHDVSTSIKAASERGEFNYQTDLAYTRIIYDLIRSEKRNETFIPYSHVFVPFSTKDDLIGE